MLAGFHVDVTTGHVRHSAGCWFASATFDPVRDEFLGFAVFRNGTTIKDVFISVASVPANASAPCATRAIVFPESGGPLATVAGSLIAFDPEPRKLFVYALRSDLVTVSLLQVDADTGSFVTLQPEDADVPTAIVVSALCGAEGGGEC